MPSKYGFSNVDEQDDHDFVERMKQEAERTAARLDPTVSDILADYAHANAFAGLVDRPDERSWRLGAVMVRVVDQGALSVTIYNALPVAGGASLSDGSGEARMTKADNLMALCTVLCEQTGCQVVLTAPVPSLAGTKELRGYIWDPSDVGTPEQL